MSGKVDISNIVFLGYFPTKCFEKSWKCLYNVQSASTYNALLEGSSEVDAVCTWFRHANFARFLKFFHHLGLLANRVNKT